MKLTQRLENSGNQFMNTTCFRQEKVNQNITLHQYTKTITQEHKYNVEKYIASKQYLINCNCIC